MSMDIIKQQINITISKTELNNIIAEAMTDPLSANAIKRILNPCIANSFPQFPDFTNVSIGDTDEDGVTTVVLKQATKPVVKPVAPIKAIEPAVELTETSDYVEPTTGDDFSR